MAKNNEDPTSSDKKDSQENNAQQEGKPVSRKRWILENLFSLALALFVVLIIRSSIIEAFKIPSGSMIPTLFVGDHIFVNKFAYGYKVPFTDWITEDPVYMARREPPERGDVIVFEYPRDKSTYFIKRVVGTPGDRIELKDKDLYINGNQVNRQPLPSKKAKEIFNALDKPKFTPKKMNLFYETLNGTKHSIMEDERKYFTANFGPKKVPKKKYFVMGDNRDHSNDSRIWGFVPFKNIRGEALVIWLSLWIDFDKDQFIFKPDRIGQVVY